jgi:hypothetical protein
MHERHPGSDTDILTTEERTELLGLVRSTKTGAPATAAGLARAAGGGRGGDARTCGLDVSPDRLALAGRDPGERINARRYARSRVEPVTSTGSLTKLIRGPPERAARFII